MTNIVTLPHAATEPPRCSVVKGNPVALFAYIDLATGDCVSTEDAYERMRISAVQRKFPDLLGSVVTAHHQTRVTQVIHGKFGTKQQWERTPEFKLSSLWGGYRFPGRINVYFTGHSIANDSICDIPLQDIKETLLLLAQERSIQLTVNACEFLTVETLHVLQDRVVTAIGSPRLINSKVDYVDYDGECFPIQEMLTDMITAELSEDELIEKVLSLAAERTLDSDFAAIDMKMIPPLVKSLNTMGLYLQQDSTNGKRRIIEANKNAIKEAVNASRLYYDVESVLGSLELLLTSLSLHSFSAATKEAILEALDLCEQATIAVDNTLFGSEDSAISYQAELYDPKSYERLGMGNHWNAFIQFIQNL